MTQGDLLEEYFVAVLSILFSPDGCGAHVRKTTGLYTTTDVNYTFS